MDTGASRMTVSLLSARSSFFTSQHSQHGPWKVIGHYLTGAPVRRKIADESTNHHRSTSDGQNSATL